MSVRRRALTGVALASAVVAALAVAPPAGAADAPTPIQTDGVWGIDFAGGTLDTVERGVSGDRFVVARKVAPDGLSASARTTWGYADNFADGDHYKQVPCDAGSCVVMRAAGNGDLGLFFVDDGKEYAQYHTGPNSHHGYDEPGVTGGQFADVSGRFFAYNAASTGKQYVDYVPENRTVDVRTTRSATAASLWGTRLYTPGSATGSVTAYDLKQKKTVETITTGAPCTVKELQAVGRWIYWNCGPTGAAGVYDRGSKTKITVPSGPALVGDGYLVRHDRSAGKLLLTDFHTATAAAPREIADLPAGNTADQRRLTWAVDRFGGDIAYVGQDNAIRIVPSGVPTQPLARMESEVDYDQLAIGTDYWGSTWQLNKPANWTFTVKDALGRTVRTIKGGPETEINLSWDGKTDAGTYTYNGAHTWQLTATAAEGTGTYTQSGSIGVGGGRQGFHDQGGYAYGELVTLNSSGGLTLHYTKGKGAFDWKQSGSGWPAGTLAVPFGDMGSDRCSEMLVRMPGGELRRYTGRCGEAYQPSSSHTSLGTGWNAYNVLVAPGDLTGDGRTDLLARKASTGDIYVFADDGHGKLAAGVKIRSHWTTYTKIVGAGDLNGDGIGDVLVRHQDGTLYRYDGAGDGQLKDRVKLYSNWGAAYNAIVGVGDITGDGKNDLVLRDTSGNLYRYAGKGNGWFEPRVKISAGWQGYKGLF